MPPSDPPSPLDWLLLREPEPLVVDHPRYGRGCALPFDEVERRLRASVLSKADLYASLVYGGESPDAAERLLDDPTTEER
jgi:hypothetical protein